MKKKTQSADSTMLQKLIEQVNKRLPYLTAGEVYTLAAILGEQYWEEVDDDVSHNSMGKLFSGLVANGHFPFQSNGWSSNRHNEYRFTPAE